MSLFPIEIPLQKDLLPVLASAITEAVKRAQSYERPYFVHTLGIPGSGKSSFVTSLTDQLGGGRTPTIVAFDRIMEKIPEYMSDQNRERAFLRYELPAREAGYFLLKDLVEKRADILLDHSGAFPKHVEMLKFAKEIKDYHVAIVRIVVDLETAKKRIQTRQSEEGRHVPLDYVDKRHHTIIQLLPLYKSVANIYCEISNEYEVDASQQSLASEAEKIATAIREMTSP